MLIIREKIRKTLWGCIWEHYYILNFSVNQIFSKNMRSGFKMKLFEIYIVSIFNNNSCIKISYFYSM